MLINKFIQYILNELKKKIGGVRVFISYFFTQEFFSYCCMEMITVNSLLPFLFN